ncbi:hypothetical protein NZNM25_07680 [Nitrosopumilus zosterae]|uniref:Uncharacterized protein n=1 Tax=Nitrosopumilus zosterae TaxID=718286 RepID=A0A2S2KQZ4_9ARCH|nr:hypothetical protein NZNM25_07680 [Nitrosopumilus zosterae]
MVVEPTYVCSSNHEFVYLITFSVGDENKTYRVCKECSKLDYFKKFIVNKIPLISTEMS